MKRVNEILGASGLVLALAFGASGLVLSLPLPSVAQVRQLPTQTVTVAGTIETIDDSRHTINLRKADGGIETVHVPVNVKQFDQFKVGDHVSATYNNTVTARLKPPGEAAVDNMGGSTSMGQNVDSGGTAAMIRTMTVTVTDVDKSAGSISVSGPNNWRYSRRVADPAMLDKIKVGDKIDITWDTSVTLQPM